MDVIIDFIGLVCQIGILCTTAALAIYQLVPYGAVLSIGNVAGFLCGSAQAVTSAFMTFALGKPIFNKFQSIIPARNANINATDSLSFKEKIEFINVSFSYPSKTVLSNVSMKFEKGKKYALVGPSGCGKTTILKLLLQFLNGYTGSILIDGKDIQTYSLESLYQQISYIDQEVYLFDTTIIQNIVLDQAFSESAISKAIEESALTELISDLPEGLNTTVGENGAKLSGGQKQRIAIARALIHQQPILLMDEGTSALDLANALEVESKLLNNPELTVILVSHHLNPEIVDKIDRIYDLRKI